MGLYPPCQFISIRAPLAGSDVAPGGQSAVAPDFNPRSPCGERRGVLRLRHLLHRISIRAPLAGSDSLSFPAAYPSGISIRAPLAGSDAAWQSPNRGGWNFNPRSPCGERRLMEIHAERIAISIRAPLAGSDGHRQHQMETKVISIRAPLAGSDIVRLLCAQQMQHFNPRSPCGERPASIVNTLPIRDFNPRSPCGERHRLRPGR